MDKSEEKKVLKKEYMKKYYIDRKIASEVKKRELVRDKMRRYRAKQKLLNPKPQFDRAAHMARITKLAMLKRGSDISAMVISEYKPIYARFLKKWRNVKNSYSVYLSIEPYTDEQNDSNLLILKGLKEELSNAVHHSAIAAINRKILLMEDQIIMQDTDFKDMSSRIKLYGDLFEFAVERVNLLEFFKNPLPINWLSEPVKIEEIICREVNPIICNEWMSKTDKLVIENKILFENMMINYSKDTDYVEQNNLLIANVNEIKGIFD